jgi:hypothetical protein
MLLIVLFQEVQNRYIVQICKDTTFHPCLQGQLGSFVALNFLPVSKSARSLSHTHTHTCMHTHTHTHTYTHTCIHTHSLSFLAFDLQLGAFFGSCRKMSRYTWGYSQPSWSQNICTFSGPLRRTMSRKEPKEKISNYQNKQINIIYTMKPMK